MNIYQKVLIVTAIALQLTPDHHTATGQQLNDREPEIKIIRIKPAILPLDNNRFNRTTNNDIIKTNNFEAPLIIIKPIKPIYNPSIKKKQHLITGEDQPLPKPKRRRIKKLKFMYEMKSDDDHAISRITRVHIAPGAYPVFYGLAKVNGSFKKSQIKSFTPDEYEKREQL